MFPLKYKIILFVRKLDCLNTFVHDCSSEEKYYLELCSGAFKVTAMQLLQCYSSYSSSSSSPEDECLSEKEFRSVYLVTYSLCGMAKFPTCLVFARAMVESFSTSTAKVVQWVCCREKHR